MYEKCLNCGKNVISDNESLCRKFFGMKTDKFMCYDCLAVHLKCEVSTIKEIELNYRKQGCMMFSPLEEE